MKSKLGEIQQPCERVVFHGNSTYFWNKYKEKMFINPRRKASNKENTFWYAGESLSCC